MKLWKIILLGVGISFICGCSEKTQTTTAQTTADSDTDDAAEVTGIDISKYQGAVDFDQVQASGITYIFIRATEGNTYQDPDFSENLTSARKAGLTIGAYHFYETDDEPQTQFDNYRNLVNLKTGDLPPVIDIEKLHDQDDSDLVANITTFLNSLESHYGVKPILYSGRNFSNQYLTQFGDYPLWLAEYGVDEPTIPDGWSTWTFWQWSQSSTADGIEGQVDADRFNGSQSDFQKLLVP